MAHAQKSDFIFRRKGRVHLHRRGRQFNRLLAAEVCASAFIVGSNAGYTTFRASVQGAGYPLHSSVSPSLPLPCVTVCHHTSTGVYNCLPSDHVVQIHDGQCLSNQKNTTNITLIFDRFIRAFFFGRGDPFLIHCGDCILVSTSYP